MVVEGVTHLPFRAVPKPQYGEAVVLIALVVMVVLLYIGTANEVAAKAATKREVECSMMTQ